MKKCTKCNIEKPLEEFDNDKYQSSGKCPSCKDCQKAYREANKERINARAKAYREANKEKVNANNKAYYSANKEKLIAYANAYEKNRLKTDPLFKLKHNCRKSISNALRKGGYSKKSRTHEMLGIDYERYKKHLESTFKKGMTWDNHGEWHIDHIIPLASAKNEEELLKLLHYSNTQALWAEENLSKKDKILEPTQVKLRI